MKTGCPGYYIPAATTVSHDAKLIFTHTRERVAKLLMVWFNFYTNSVNKITTHLGARWLPEPHHRLLDIPQSLGLHGAPHPAGSQRHTNLSCPQRRWAAKGNLLKSNWVGWSWWYLRAVAHGLEYGHRVQGDPGRIRYWAQGINELLNISYMVG